MLKSHFNLQRNVGEEQAPVTDEQVAEEHGEMSVEEEEKKVYPTRILKKSEISSRLSFLGKIAEGDGYTYLKATCTGLQLTDLSALKTFKHLQFVDVSNNFLDLDALQALTELPFLVLIHADKNILRSAALKRMKYLQVLIMNENHLTSVHNVYQPELSTLEVGNNKIQTIYFENRMPNIKCLDFRNNFIQEIENLDFPNLDSLYLAGNKITNLVGLEKLVNLRILHVRDNPIRLLNGFDPALTKLQYINLRSCKVATLKQIKKLRVLTALDTLILKGCPYMGGEEEAGNEEEDPETRVEILATLPRLKRINKGVVTPDERNEAKDLMTQWLEEGEKEEEEQGEEHEEESNVED